MIVVADTSPINYLILIEEIDILTRIYGTIVIPHSVREELLRSSAPDPSLATLDPGERDAIMLAEELRANQLIVDDRQGRREAEKRGIPVIGTLGVIREAATLGLLDLRIAVRRLETTSFYVAPEVLSRLFEDQP